MRNHCLVALALASLSGVSVAQTDGRLLAPAIVADSFFRAASAERWYDAAHFLDLDAIGRIRDDEVRSLRHRPTRPTVTVDDFLKFDPKMPREVAEYQVRQIAERAQDTDFLEYEFAHVGSVDTLAALPTVEVAARWLEARGMRWQMHRSLEFQRKRGCDFPDSLEAAMFSHPNPVRIRGAVVEDSVAWVLHDELGFGADPGAGDSPPRARRARPVTWAMPPHITTLHLVGGAWRVLPSMSEGGMSFAADCPRMSRTPAPTKE